jgi:hypothetical protein
MIKDDVKVRQTFSNGGNSNILYMCRRSPLFWSNI